LHYHRCPTETGVHVKELRIVAVCLAISAILPAAASAGDLDDLSWLAGAWSAASEHSSVEEHWTPPAGGMMLAVSRTIVDGKAVAFEFLRIEERPDGIVYVAQPNGRPGTEFRLTQLEGQRVVFENPGHDHPKLFRYMKTADGELRIEIEGDEGSTAFALEALSKP
jgi:hypothetical protein